jgi:hypothetical protein
MICEQLTGQNVEVVVGICLERKTMGKISERIVGVSTIISTGHLLNTRQKHNS